MSKFYRLPGGFLDSTDFVERKPDGGIALHMKGGKVTDLGREFTDYFDEHIADGTWKEIQPEKK